jgi:hypothetical protein
MEITQSIQTPSTLIASNVRPASDFGMSNGGQSCFGVLVEARTSWIPATGLSFMTTEGADLRDRKDLAAKGHVAVAAYVPGYPAWSPPIC